MVAVPFVGEDEVSVWVGYARRTVGDGGVHPLFVPWMRVHGLGPYPPHWVIADDFLPRFPAATWFCESEVCEPCRSRVGVGVSVLGAQAAEAANRVRKLFLSNPDRVLSKRFLERMLVW